MRRVVSLLMRSVVSAGILALCLSRPAHAHAIHSTMSVVTREAGGLTIRVRAFADDFSGAVARFVGRRAPADSSAPEADVLRYVQAQFSVTDARGVPLALVACGIKRERELFWLCFKAATPRGGAGEMLCNRMLTEWHADQVNVVQLEGPRARKTMLFTKKSTPAPIGAA